MFEGLGELVPDPARSMTRETPAWPPAVVPVVATARPEVNLAELDKGIATRRDRLAGIAARLEAIERALAAPATGRLKTLVLGKRDDHAALVAERDTVQADHDRLAGELRELELAREPVLAALDCQAYDALRPALRTLIGDLARTFAEAEALYAAGEDVMRRAEQVRASGILRGCLAAQGGRPELPSPDARELALLRGLQALLQRDGVNPTKLQRWRAECRQAGIEV